jgi:5-methylcytosine-specific restriction endonuclease McrA
MDEISPSRRRYQQYLQSPEWRELRRQVWRRCSGVCERCGENPMDHVHHLSYERVFQEELDDLQGVCGWCHLCSHGLATPDHLMEMCRRL